MSDVVCVGIIVADHVSQPLDRLPEAGELMHIEDPLLTIGGCAANVAFDLVKLGVSASVTGVVGTDGLGQFLIDELASHGVDTSRIRKTDAKPTSQTIILPVKGEDRRFIHAFGANAVIDARDVSPAVLEGAKVLYVGGYFVMPKITQETLCTLFAEARSRGIRTVLDVVIPDPGEYRSQLEELLPLTDVFLPNDDEGQAITGSDDPLQQGRAYRGMGASTAVVTCGQEGGVWIDAKGQRRFGVYPTEYVDGAGSGDAFTAGYIYGLLRGFETLDCIRRAAALGASCVAGLGTTAGVFTADQLERFVSEHELPIGDAT